MAVILDVGALGENGTSCDTELLQLKSLPCSIVHARTVAPGR
jgi:hypothetical protein